MKIQRIYTDTSVIGGCFDEEFADGSNGLMADFERGIFRPVVSVVVAAEVAEAPDFVQAKFSELLSFGAEVLDISVEAMRLAELYQKRGILGPNFFNDGLHIALATIAEIDVIVSWNFKHIVNFQKIRRFNAVNLESGYRMIGIYSPNEVRTYEV